MFEEYAKRKADLLMILFERADAKRFIETYRLNNTKILLAPFQMNIKEVDMRKSILTWGRAYQLSTNYASLSG